MPVAVSAETRALADELGLPLVWAKAWRVDQHRWGWCVCTDPIDWWGSQLLASSVALEKRNREDALRIAKSWAETRGIYVGELP